VLNQVLSAYVENFNPKQLNVGIWGGDIKLKSVDHSLSRLIHLISSLSASCSCVFESQLHLRSDNQGFEAEERRIGQVQVTCRCA
jgi:hypothetical protein